MPFDEGHEKANRIPWLTSHMYTTSNWKASSFLMRTKWMFECDVFLWEVCFMRFSRIFGKDIWVRLLVVGQYLFKTTSFCV